MFGLLLSTTGEDRLESQYERLQLPDLQQFASSMGLEAADQLLKLPGEVQLHFWRCK